MREDNENAQQAPELEVCFISIDIKLCTLYKSFVMEMISNAQQQQQKIKIFDIITK